MVERFLTPEKIESLARQLERFLGWPSSLKAVREYLHEHPGASIDQIFNELAHRQGAGKSHLSGKRVGGTKGHFNVSSRKARRHRW
jgi:hypothetical protein